MIARWRRPERRSQAGVTVIELLIVVMIGGLVLVPVFGLLTFTLRRHEPTRETNDQASQLRLFRSHIARDWAGAAEIHTGFNAADTGKFECNHGVIWGTAVIAIVYVGKVQQGGTPNDPQRILYEIRNEPDGTKSLVRRECRHYSPPPDDPDEPWGGAGSSWTQGGSVQTDNAPGGVDGGSRGSAKRIVWRIEDLVVPEACNPTFDGSPLELCDMNVTLRTTDGQSASVRLRQEIGRTS